MFDIKKLRQELNNVPDDFIVLVEIKAEDAFEVTLESVKLLTEKNDHGIIISASRPYLNLLNNYERRNIDTKKVHIVDLISKNQDPDVQAENVMFVDNASSLTHISLSVNDYIKKLNGKKFIFIDSITTMLIHNEPYVFARFLHSVLTRMRINGVGGLMISIVDRTNREIRAEIAQLCDKVIKLD